eukprot:IDg7048t1
MIKPFENITIGQALLPVAMKQLDHLQHDIAMDLLGELTPTRRGNKFLLVIVDRFTKLLRTIPLRQITALDIAKAFTTQWAFVYGVPKSFLTENGRQFNAKFLPEVPRTL